MRVYLREHGKMPTFPQLEEWLKELPKANGSPWRAASLQERDAPAGAEDTMDAAEDGAGAGHGDPGSGGGCGDDMDGDIDSDFEEGDDIGDDDEEDDADADGVDDDDYGDGDGDDDNTSMPELDRLIEQGALEVSSELDSDDDNDGDGDGDDDDDDNGDDNDDNTSMPELDRLIEQGALEVSSELDSDDDDDNDNDGDGDDDDNGDDNDDDSDDDAPLDEVVMAGRRQAASLPAGRPTPTFSFFWVPLIHAVLQCLDHNVEADADDAAFEDIAFPRGSCSCVDVDAAVSAAGGRARWVLVVREYIKDFRHRGVSRQTFATAMSSNGYICREAQEVHMYTRWHGPSNEWLSRSRVDKVFLGDLLERLRKHTSN